MKKPVIFYVDDEPFQHVAFEQIAPDNWDIHCFDNPLDAIGKLKELNPCLIVSDQRMPQMQGFKFLETASQICPDAIRIITTGYSDENSIIESIRSAKIFDYIVKPWDIEKLLTTLERALEYYEAETSRKYLTIDIEKKNSDLKSALTNMENLVHRYQAMELELKSWVHPFALNAIKEKYTFPLKKDLTLLVFDLVNSSSIHGQSSLGLELRTRILQTFWEIVLKHGGEVERYEGDKGYANFGLTDGIDNPSNAAFAAAKEFRSSIQAINDHFNTTVETGIAIHFAQDCLVNLRQVAINTMEGIVIRKWFDTSSSDVDLCHRLESHAHIIPGSNILMTETVHQRVTANTTGLIPLGSHTLKGQKSPTAFLLLKSTNATPESVEKLKEALSKNNGSAAA